MDFSSTLISPIRLCVILNGMGRGGAETQLLRLCGIIDPTQVELTVACYGGKATLLQHYRQTPARIVLFDREHISRARFFGRLARFLRSERFDIVHCWHGSANHYGALAAILAGTPCILTGFRNYSVECAFSRWLDRLIEPMTVFRVVNSHAIREKHARTVPFPRDKLVVLHNGVNPADFSEMPDQVEARRLLGLDPVRQTLMVVGRLEPVKRQILLVEAARILTTRGLKLQYVLIGDGGDRTQLQEAIEAYGLAQQFHLLGERQDVAAAIRAATLLVCTSVTEGLPNVVLESMFAAIPVITTDNGGGPELLANAEQVFPVENPSALADRIAESLVQPDRLRRWADAERERALRLFTIDSAAHRYVQILRVARARALIGCSREVVPETEV